MLKKILSYGFVEGVAKGLNKLIFLVLPLFLGTIGYGKIGLILALEMIVPIITLLGLERAVLRFYGEKESFSSFGSTLFSAIIITHGVALVMLVIGYALGMREFFSLSLFPDLFIVLLIVFFQGRNLLTLNIFRVLERHQIYFKGRLFLQISKFILVVISVIFLDSYLGYLYGSLVAVILTNVFFVIKKESSSQENSKRFNNRTFNKLLVFSWPFIFHGIAANLLGNADKFIIERFLSLEEVGLYTFAYAIGSMMLFAYIGISVFVEPLIYKENNLLQREKLLDKYLFLSLGLGLLSFIIISVGTEFVVPLVYGNVYDKSLIYVPYISLAFLIYPYYLTASYRMIYNKKSLHIALVSIVSAIINIGLNIYFIPEYGVYAAVIITALSYVLQALLFVLISHKFALKTDIFEVLLFGIIILGFIYAEITYYFALVPGVFLLGYLYIFKFKLR